MKIKELRTQLNITQQALADKLGVSVKTVKRWEANESKPSRLAIRQIERLIRKGAVG